MRDVGDIVKNIRLSKKMIQILHCNETFKNENLKTYNHVSMLLYLGSDICIKCLLQSDHKKCENCKMGKHHN